ncbi:MAG: hypothetical protein IPO78_11475 [Saprospiraceae bacterium]|nr:hypothetical protein [Saprospiraceae bacterium]MBK8451471.1 hypothetical protein [Saprospiraceae bacterium]MBK8483430.1 hypothetical protein [Saprospiraceae bacterium]MBK9220939.1 hypothetical protein [Saprospiraceae bacterium]MBK9722216.1 hypothetical protein [Saprospiraceae bacterium]
MKIPFYLLILSFFHFTCTDDNSGLTGKGTLEIVFKAVYDSKPLYVGNAYDYFGSGTIKFSKGDFFISDLRLKNIEDNVQVKDVDYISLIEHQVNEATALEGLVVKYTNIKSGDYSELNFDFGLSSDLNKKKPAEFAPTHPLGEGTHYWAGWNSYIYSKTEGVFSTGSSNFNFSYHSGFDAAKRFIQFSKLIKIRDSEITKILIEIDYKKLFDEGGLGMDIAANPQIHNTSSIMNAFVDRFQSSIQIK